jgi:putative peptidoglycan lipid II flippase
MVALALPTVRIIYERYAFNLEASEFVASILVAYSVGMFFYLGRDVLVRVFYGLGDGQTPFKVSIFNIFLNGLLDFILVKSWGAPGLVLATVAVNIVSMGMFLWLLHLKLNGLPWREWSLPFLGLTIISLISGFVSWGTLQGLRLLITSDNFGVLLMELVLPGAVGLIVFAILILFLKLPEVDLLVSRLRQKFQR